MKKKEFSFPTIIGLIITMVGLAVGVFLLRNPLLALVGASPEETPAQVRITNISDTEFVVSWITDKATSGFIQYGEGTPELVVSDDRDQEKGEVGSYFTHFVTVKNLTPQTNYSFKIGSGRSSYDLQGLPYQVATGPVLRNPPGADVAFGQVVTANGDPAEGSIVYLKLPGIVPQAALVKSSGSWVVPLSTSRTTDLTSFAPYDLENDKLEVSVQSGAQGTAEVITTTANDSPLADIVLGTTLDNTLINISPTPSDGSSASASATTESKFSSDTLLPGTTSTPSAVSILTPEILEEVNTAKPEIIGRGPAGTEITIEIHSTTAIVDTVVVGADGTWSYSVPQNLEPGSHTITVTALIDGVVKSVTRSFTVQAAGESNSPAFSATSSGTIKPTPSVVASPTVTAKVTSTPKPIPTPTTEVRVSNPSTASGIPESGNLTPTLLASILGIGLIIIGVVTHKKYL